MERPWDLQGPAWTCLCLEQERCSRLGEDGEGLEGESRDWKVLS